MLPTRTPPTSRRKREKALAAAPPAPPGHGPELLRRALLGLATGLIVVRALTPGEDVGLLDPGTNPLGLAVPLLWLCGLATWAAGRLWTRQTDWYGGLVELGLLVVVLFAFIGTTAVAAYRHPAWVVSWEWVGLLAALFLVRQVARSASDQRGLLAALLATGVCLAAQSVSQHVLPDRGHAPLPGLTADELPRRRCEVLAQLGNAPQNAFPASLSLPALVLATGDSDPTLFERVAVRNNVRPETGEPALPLALRPTPPQPPAATFTAESNLAGCLALLLPALAGCALAAWLGGAPRWQIGVALGCTLLTALALWLTQARSALLPCLLVGAAASVLAWRHYSARPPLAPGGRGVGSEGVRGDIRAPGPSPRGLLLLALAGPAALLLAAFVIGPREGFAGLAREWSAAWAIIREHFWLGVGPGNYGRHYPQYMDPTAPEVARQPGSFFLETWATLGLPALLALGVALVSFFRRTLSFVPRPSSPVPGDGQGTEDEGQGTRWEFYEGGMVGLLVGFVFRALPLTADDITAEAVAAGVRAVVWFAAFALIHGIRWGGATRVLACAAGVAALLLHLSVAGSIVVPGVAQPLWVMAALALNGLPEQPLPLGQQYLVRVLPLALAAAAALLCALSLFEPVTSGASTDKSALAAAQKYLDVRSRVTQSQPEGQTEYIADVGKALEHIIKRLEDAVAADPGNARHWADLANWYGEISDPYERGVRYALTAQGVDPFGEAGYLAEARIHLIAASRAPTAELRRKAADDAVKPLQTIVAKRPNDVQLHYRLAAALFAAGDKNLGRVHAARALELHDLAPTPGRRLTDPQYEQARRFATGAADQRPLP